MEIKIGDKVKIKAYEDIPQELKARVIGNNPHLWNSGKSKTCGKVGTVIDHLYSNGYECDVYRVKFDGEDLPSRSLFDIDAFEPVEEETPAEFSFKIDIAENVVIANMLQDGKQVGRGHAHIIHDGTIGIAQAASYALKRLYSNMNGGSFIGGDYRG